MNSHQRSHVAVAASLAALLIASDAAAYRMIQNTSVGRSSNGTRVTCDAPAGFAHWTRAGLEWRLNTTRQGGEAGVPAALQGALSSWTAVTPANYQLAYGGSTGAGFQTDGVNTVLWAIGNGCSGGCLAITALVIGPGQEILEADVSFNDAFDWRTSGVDYDGQAIAAHELGHCLGIHHTEITRHKNRPTMYSTYIGIEGRTLELDDRDALNCAFSRYPPPSLIAEPVSFGGAAGPPDLRLVQRMRAGQRSLRFALLEPTEVQLDVFDVAGRRVATLASGTRGAGEHEVALSGRTNPGLAHKGIYFARLTTPQGRGSATILVGE